MKTKAPILIFASLSLFACTQTPSSQWTDEEIEAKINDVLPQLTLAEKIRIIHAQSKFSSGGVERLGIPELWMDDGPHGVRAETLWDDWGYAGATNDSATAFPALTALAATFNPALSADYGTALGEESRYRQKDVQLGPGVNIYRTPLNGRNFEYMGEDPYLASQMVVPYIRGLQSNTVAACVKHFALNNQETWRNKVDVHVSDRALREIYLPAFRAAVVDGGAWSIMGSYNLYDGQQCCHNKKLNDILRNEWGFDGCVITDWGGATDTREAAENGLDIEMGTWTNGLTTSAHFAYDEYFLARPYEKALRNGEIPMETIDAKVRNVLRLMYRTSMAKTRPLGRKGNKEHFETALNVAHEAIVLLKNENNLLPLDPTTTCKIAVIGQNATRSMMGGGSSELKPYFEISPLDGLRQAFPNAQISYSMGYASGPDVYAQVIPSPLPADSLRQAAIALAKESDLVIFIGGLTKSHQQDCEAGDRTGLNLPFGQDELIEQIAEVNKNIVGLFISGNAFAMPWLDKVPAVVQAWYLGSEAGQAIADVVSGAVNPSGKLPISFPVRLEDNGAHSFADKVVFPGDSANAYRQEYREDILVGYRWHDTKQIPALFAFGYGKSYTSFAVTDVKVSASASTVSVSANVENTGSLDGKEVVQVYVGKKESSVARALKELKGFKKVSVAAGAKESVSLSIPVESLAFYNEEKSAWEVEKGTYTAYVGTSSADIVAEIEFEVK